MTDISDRPEELLQTLDKYLVEAYSRKAEEITVLDVRELTSYADAIVIITARSQRHVSSIAEHMHIAMKKIDNMAIGMEGLKQGTWALLDYGDVIINVFDKETRDFYDLEGLWCDAPKVDTSAYETETEKTGDDDE
ncbi:MAG: ribosome silencing factor [Desulfobacteraceae bacterium]|nr:ribosome silencing factor [Desulfobacteraceae bacterium]